MTYQETLQFLYYRLPMYQRVGSVAFKKDLTNTIRLCEYLGNPHQRFKTIHVAGTNGKGSTAHSLAAVLQAAGYKTGLYTSPHLKNFTERIKINGSEISEHEVVEIVDRTKEAIENIQPSFFEMTVAMAFEHFAKHKVDIAVIEVGLGGRLDSTNIITPEVSVITNISYDHQNMLGDTLQEIAFEKAGIIKKEVPVIISEHQIETESVFIKMALMKQTKISFASLIYQAQKKTDKQGKSLYDIFKSENLHLSDLEFDLNGDYQRRNIPGILLAIDVLNENGFTITEQQVREGLASIKLLTGLKGRWQKLGEQPLIICDTGHNPDGIKEILMQINKIKYKNLKMVIGMVNDKDQDKILSLLPKEAFYYFCQADIPRALSAEELHQKAVKHQLNGKVIPNVNEAVKAAKADAGNEDMIFIGGSTFVVAELENL